MDLPKDFQNGVVGMFQPGQASRQKRRSARAGSLPLPRSTPVRAGSVSIDPELRTAVIRDHPTTTGASDCRVTVAAYEGTAVLYVQGELDSMTGAALRADLAPAVGEEAVLLDLYGVGLLDTVGVGELGGFIRDVHDRGGLAAVAGGPSVGRALRAGGLDRQVFVTDSAPRALSWLAHPANRARSDSRPWSSDTGGRYEVTAQELVTR